MTSNDEKSEKSSITLAVSKKDIDEFFSLRVTLKNPNELSKVIQRNGKRNTSNKTGTLFLL